jgi:hypothetical protein
MSVLAVEFKGESFDATPLTFSLFPGYQLLLRIKVNSNSKFIMSDGLYNRFTTSLSLL